jgi:N-acetyl-gamma-glutamyl-phosphate reductase
MTARIFIDGAAGTTGLGIRKRLEGRKDIEVVSLEGERRKDPAAREAEFNRADLAILCLPDAAAIAALELVHSSTVRVLDASTAHRTAPGWVYGFPELQPGQRAAIQAARRVSNPGCHATGFVASMRPLVDAGIVPHAAPLSVHALTGYSGGGREMIELYEAEAGADAPDFALYALDLAHKHGPEMRAMARLERPPLFVPGVGNFHSGLVTIVPLHLWALPGEPSAKRVHDALAEHYRGEPFIRVAPLEELGTLRAGKYYLDVSVATGKDTLELFVFSNDSRREAVVVARLDNLGKGASGAAVQNMNLMLGLGEDTGLSSARH